MSRFSGMLAAGLGGGAGVVAQQAFGDIQQQREGEMAAQRAAIEEQMRLRVAEAQERIRLSGRAADFKFDNDPTNVATRQGTARSDALNSAATARQATVESVNDTAFQGARRTQADRDAEDAAARERRKVTGDAADPLYLSSLKTLKLADPEVAARIAASRAQAASAGAQAGMLAAQTEGIKLNNADKKKLDGLYDQASSILSDAKLTDEERAKKFGDVQRQIVLMKSKNGTGGTKDPEIDTETIKETKINPDGSTTETTRKQVRKPGNMPAKDGAAGPAVGTEVDGYVFNGGDPNDQKNWTRKGGAPAPKPSAPTPPPAPEETPPDSPSGRFKARQAQLKKDQEDMAAVKAASAKDRAAELLKGGTPEELDAFQRSELFNLLDVPTKRAISQRLRTF